jgi:hypothetical protein
MLPDHCMGFSLACTLLPIWERSQSRRMGLITLNSDGSSTLPWTRSVVLHGHMSMPIV